MIFSKEEFKKVDLDNLVDAKVITGRIAELLLIVPTNRRLRTLKKEIISALPNKSGSKFNIETLGTISAKLLEAIQPFQTLSEAAATVFIKQSASEINLEYFSLYKKEIPFGTLDRIKNIISEYKRHGIYPDNLINESNKLEKSEKLKAIDIANIYQRYLEKCNRLNALELGDIYQKLNNVEQSEFENTFQELYPDVDLIVITGFDQFTLLEQQIIEKLALYNRAKLFINFEYFDGNHFIFYHLQKCFSNFHEMGFKKIQDIGEERDSLFKKIIRENLFNKKKDKKHDFKNKITSISAFNREKEIEEIAKEVKRLLLDEKVECHKIAVVFNLIQNYSSIVRDIFNKYGIPVNLTDRISLDNSKPVTAIINYLEIAENDFYYKNIFRALSSGFINSQGIDLTNLFKVASELKIISGKNNWITTLNDSIGSLKSNYEEDDEEGRIAKKSYQKALNDIESIINVLKPFEDDFTIQQFKEKLFEFIYRSELPIKLLSISDNQEENIRGFTAFLDTTEEIFKLLQDELGNTKKFQLNFFMEIIRTTCSWGRYNVKEKSNYGVQVTNLNELRGLKFDYLFIGGLCDGDLPTKYQPEIFHTPSFKKNAFYHQTEERNLFYQALSAWNKKLYLTFPLSEGGREIVPSTFFKDFTELFEVNSLSQGENDDLVCSQQEVEILIGKESTSKLDNDLLKVVDKMKIDLGKIKNDIFIEWQRETNPFVESIYNGFLLWGNDNSTDQISEFLKPYSQKQYSISQLETYAKCPFKFFTERVLKITAFEEPTEEIESLELGRVLHSILFEFYSKVRESGKELDSCNEDAKAEFQKLIFDIARKEISRNSFKSPLSFYELEKLLGIDGNERESILYKFIQYECEHNTEKLPSFFEVRFGSMKEDSSDKELSDIEPLKIDEIKLRGKIDRIDISKSDDSFDIIDYKLSGKKPTLKELKTGISLQLPVYLLATSILLKKKYNRTFKPNDMIIYSLKYSSDKFGKDKVSIKSDKEITSIEQLIEISIEHIKKYINQISEGRFILSPHENREKLICSYCQFKSVCRIEELV